jgi:uncharacterized NAD(P)/FAD-binding protein YdhS
MNYRRVNSPLLKSLFAQGLATAGPLGGGLRTTGSGQLIANDGEASEVLFPRSAIRQSSWRGR